MINIDVICPVYKSFENIKSLLESLKLQKNVCVKKIVCSLTVSDDAKEDSLIEECFKEHNVIYFKTSKEEFSHSLTRERMIRDYCEEDIVVLLTQDVVLGNEYSLFNLVKSIGEKKTSYNYGRQIVKKNCIEKYIRKKNYPVNSCVTEKKDNMTIMDYFASDSFSAINRKVFLEIGGYQGKNLMFNEDQLLSYYLINKGHKKGYVSDAIVYHSHKYKLKDLKERYYQSGKFYKENAEFKDIKTNGTGFKLSLYVFKEVLIHFDIVSLFLFIPNMMARYLGFKKGKK